MKIKFLGHAGFLIDDLVIDPFLTGNPKAVDKPADIQCKYVLITHDHPDHVGDAFDIAKKNDAVVVGMYEVTAKAEEAGCKTEPMNIGGKIKLGGWEIKMEMAFHSAGVGAPASFIIKKSGKTVYHAGDTCYFMDMERFKEYSIDIAMLPIGDRFTMGAEDAAKACKAIGCKTAIPIHFGTFPFLGQSADTFKKLCSCDCVVFDVGEVKEL
ncbi:metal-dependent hydrolase [Candidatus Woesearchaeota archaeon]|nr:metal-dependent hydrolase [Candidatus Woesearchaeota archaeon]